jgi:beta-lactamase regulating signal transducer with metallopeptidase domain
MTLTLLVVAWLLTYLVHSTLLLGGAWLLSTAGLVRAPIAREVLWKVCLVGGILTATVYSLSPYQPYSFHVLLPSVTASAPAASIARIEPSASVSADVALSSSPAPRPSSVAAVRPATASHAQLAAAASPIPNPQSPIPSWPRLLLGLWILGAGCLVARTLVRRLRLMRSLRLRREIAGGPLALMLHSLKTAAGVRRPIRLTVSSELAGPVAIGASEICLPERALTSLDAAQQRAVLAHELGHLVRQDPLWLGVAVAVESLLFFQPLNRLARRRMQEAAEYLSDDWAVRQTGGSLTLAKCLAEVATWMEAASAAVPVAGMAENPSQLVERVRRLLDGTQPAARGFRVAVPVAALALSSMAFAAPGVSPPCDQEAQLQDAGAGATMTAARAAWQGEPKTWATIRDGHVLVFRDGFAPRLTGRGHLGIRRGGRMIELGAGQRLLVNGREPSDRHLVEVSSTDSLEIVGDDGRTFWRIEPVRVARAETLAWRHERGPAAERAMERVGDRWDSLGAQFDSLGAQFDSLGDRFDGFDTLDYADIAANAADIASNAAEISANVTSSVAASLMPQIAALQELGVRLGADIAPRVAELSGRIVGEVVPAIVQGLCDGGLCDDSAPRVKRHKVLIKRP